MPAASSSIPMHTGFDGVAHVVSSFRADLVVAMPLVQNAGDAQSAALRKALQSNEGSHNALGRPVKNVDLGDTRPGAGRLLLGAASPATTVVGDPAADDVDGPERTFATPPRGTDTPYSIGVSVADSFLSPESADVSVSALTTAPALPEMLPSLVRLRAARTPVAIHASSFGLSKGSASNPTDATTLTSSHSVAATIARQAGIPLLASSSHQEAHDTALAAEVLARTLGSPVLHIMDPVSAQQSVTGLRLAGKAQLEDALAASASVNVSVDSLTPLANYTPVTLKQQVSDISAAVSSESLNSLGSTDTDTSAKGTPRAHTDGDYVGSHQLTRAHVTPRTLPAGDRQIPSVRRALMVAGSALGRSEGSNLVEYIGDSNATTVLVAPRYANAVTLTALAHARPSTGVLLLRLVHPFPADAFRDALPSTVSRIVVVDSLGSQETVAESALALRVSASLRRRRGSSEPRLSVPVFRVALVDADAFASPAQAAAALAAALANPDVRTTTDLIVSPTSRADSAVLDLAQQYRLAPNSTALALVFSSDHTTPADLPADLLADHSDEASVYELRGAEATATTLVFGRGAAKVTGSAPLGTATLAVLENPAVAQTIDVAAHVCSGASLIVNLELPDAKALADNEVLNLLPDSLVRGLISKKATLLAFDANAAGGGKPSHALALALKVARGATIAGITLRRIALPETAPEPTPLGEGEEPPVPPTPLTRQALFSALAVSADKAKNASEEPRMISAQRRAALAVLFPEAHAVENKLFPDEPRPFPLAVKKNQRLTPLDYERNVFHLEFTILDKSVTYKIGDALAIAGHNEEAAVLEFLERYGSIDPNTIVELPAQRSDKSGRSQLRTALQAFTQSIDIFGRPPRAFYETLVDLVTAEQDKKELARLLSPAGAPDLAKMGEETVTFADLLLNYFPSARPDIHTLVRIVPPVKMRLYSIASSAKTHPGEVHLLVVTHDWVTPSGVRHVGQCTRYLEALQPGDTVTGTLKASVMHLPPDDKQPIIMAGLGTGMAPFRAFVEERVHRAAARGYAADQSGEMALYFGSRTRAAEYLYGEEFEAYHESGMLQRLQLAFSRDQAHKVYIQHKLAEDGEMIADYLLNKKGHFYLCGPTWPVPDVKKALVDAFVRYGGIENEAAASDLLEELKEEGRYVLEVY